MIKVEVKSFIIKPYILAKSLSNNNCGEYVQVKVHILQSSPLILFSQVSTLDVK
jgi:hypothetical protein